MKRIKFTAVLFLSTLSIPTFASECFNLENGKIYDVKASDGVCFKTNVMKPIIYSNKQNQTMFEVNTGQSVELIFPDQLFEMQHVFYISSLENYHISRQGDIVLLIDNTDDPIRHYSSAPIRVRRNAGAAGAAAATIAGSTAGAVISNANPANAAIGAAAGVAAGTITTNVAGPTAGIVVGNAVATAVTNGLENANSGIGSGRVLGTNSHSSISGPAGSCIGCHQKS